MWWALAILMVGYCSCATFHAKVEIVGAFQPVCANSSSYRDALCTCLRQSHPEYTYQCDLEMVDDSPCSGGRCLCTPQRRLMKGSTKKKENKTKDVFVSTDVSISVTTNANLSYSVGVCRNHPFYSYESGLHSERDDLYLIIICSIVGGAFGLLLLYVLIMLTMRCILNFQDKRRVAPIPMAQVVPGAHIPGAHTPEGVPLTPDLPVARGAPPAPEYASRVSRKYIQYKIL